MIKTFFTTFFLLLLFHSSTQAYILGSKIQKPQILNFKNSIVWSYDGKEWSVSKPLNELNVTQKHFDNNHIVLVNNDNFSYREPLHKKNSYTLKKGWNYLATPENGADVVKTFSVHSEVKFVFLYDKRSHIWAGYSADKSLQEKLNSTRMIALKYIEQHLGFYVYSTKAKTIEIQSTQINETCQKALVKKGYKLLLDSGLDDNVVYDLEKTVGVSSRYLAHHKRGIFDDTRVALIYKEEKNISHKKLQKYGIASPKMFIAFPKERGDSYFFVFDYKTKECYLGAFPSEKVPPFSSLKKIN